MNLGQTGCNWHMNGSKDGEARHSTPGPTRGHRRAECMVAHAKGSRTCARWPNTCDTNRQPEGTDSSTRQPPQLHQTPHQRRRQRDRREEQQVTEAAHKEQHRRLHRQAKAHLDGLPEAWPPTLTKRLKRPPAPTGAKRPTKPRKARRAWKMPRISRTQGVVGSKPLGDGGLQAPKIPENLVDFR